jgi:hypothetical protein
VLHFPQQQGSSLAEVAAGLRLDPRSKKSKLQILKDRKPFEHRLVWFLLGVLEADVFAGLHEQPFFVIVAAEEFAHSQQGGQKAAQVGDQLIDLDDAAADDDLGLGLEDGDCHERIGKVEFGSAGDLIRGDIVLRSRPLGQEAQALRPDIGRGIVQLHLPQEKVGPIHFFDRGVDIEKQVRL